VDEKCGYEAGLAFWPFFAQNGFRPLPLPTTTFLKVRESNAASLLLAGQPDCSAEDYLNCLQFKCRVIIETSNLLQTLNTKTMRTKLRIAAAALSLAAAMFVTSCRQQEPSALEEDGDVQAAATIVVGTCTDQPDGSPTNTLITTNTTWTSNNQYVIRGLVRVTNGATLTIQPGTIIRGECEGSLVIERDGAISAAGTPSDPIIFTSNRPVGSRAPGDWGGLIILGEAPNNQGPNVPIEGVNVPPGSTLGLYGGTNPNDNSGVLQYLRIEYPGGEIAEGNEINGLTLGSVGRGTTIDHVQVLYAQDDGFEWFGGNVNARYLYAFGCSDDDFDTDFGYTGLVQFAAGVKLTSSEPGNGASNGFESDNDAAGSSASPRTAPKFSNVTLSGPCGSDPAVFGRGLLIRRNSALQIANSIVSEWGVTADFTTAATGTPAFLSTRNTTDVASPLPTGFTFLSGVLPGDCPRPTCAPEAAPNLVRSGNSGIGTSFKFPESFFVATNYRGAFSAVRADNNGWDLRSENPAFDWLSFKCAGR
jgi:hypothetical protein